MGNNCFKPKKKQPTSLKIPSDSLFSMDSILKELDKYPKNENAHHITSELNRLNSCSIVVSSYVLDNFNVPLANILCSTCFNSQQTSMLIKIVLTANPRVNLNDLLLSCLEFALPSTSNLILDHMACFMGKEAVNQKIFTVYIAVYELCLNSSIKFPLICWILDIMWIN